MEPIPSWSEERVSEWLQGLDAPLHQYPVSEWRLSGLDLLQLTSQDLERLGVQKIGHQELVLEAVEKLCSLTYGIGGENLRGLTEKMRAVAHSLQMGIQNRWRLNTYDGRSTTKLPASVLQVVVELIASAKGLFSMLTRHPLFQHSGSTFTKHIFSYCKDLGDIVHRDTTVYEKEKDIISVCRQLVGACDEILNASSEALLAHSAHIESVDLVPVSPGDQLGIEITSTSSSNHYVSGTAAETSNNSDVKILDGDEVIQVNDQVVVGWSRENLVKKLRENPNGVTLVLKRLPGTTQAQRKDSVPRLSTPLDEEEQEKNEDENPRQSVLERVAASVRSLSFRKGPEIQQQFVGHDRPELSPELERSLSVISSNSQQGRLSPLSASGDFEGLDSSKLSPAIRRRAQTSTSRSASPLHLGSFRSSSPLNLGSFRSCSPLRSGSFRSSSPQLANQDTVSISSCPEMVGHTGNKDTKKSSTKGMSTALSRRRVSCRELGKPDCDGWLWKKRKETGVFITHKWQRFWFILKGPSLYWYTTQQDEKAEGFVNVASYSIESAGEHKRKYVFKMSHQRFQNFFFAADTVSDMSKWINFLIAAIQKFRKSQKGPDSEEECYSETESESERSPSPHRAKKVQSNSLPRPKGKTKVPPLNLPAGGRKGTGAPEDEMSVMMNSIKEGGVSLIGHDQPFTQDHFRKSFIKRNKNPVINEFAHKLRTLESTLKAKEAELQQINKLLGDSSLTASKYRQWKEKNEELLLDIEKHCPPKTSKGGDKSAAQDAPAKDDALETVATETAAAETEGAYRLSLSDGEQLVDAEPEVQKEIPEGSPSPGSSPVLELSLGSLQESINKRLSEMAESGAAADNYFYI